MHQLTPGMPTVRQHSSFLDLHSFLPSVFALAAARRNLHLCNKLNEMQAPEVDSDSSYLWDGGYRFQPRVLPKAMRALCCSLVGTTSPFAIAKSCFSYHGLVWCRSRLSRVRCLSSSLNGFGDGFRPGRQRGVRRTSSPDVSRSSPSSFVFRRSFMAGVESFPM
jgi:hypothetical protein